MTHPITEQPALTGVEQTPSGKTVSGATYAFCPHCGRPVRRGQDGKPLACGWCPQHYGAGKQGRGSVR